MFHDLIGMHTGRVPKFVKAFASVGDQITEALKEYSREVREKVFPAKEHSFSDPAPVRMVKS